jgi:hypothetical protein
MLGSMWLDQRGSEVLPRSECLRLLAVAAAAGSVGRVAAVADPATAPLLRPVNFGFVDDQVLLRLGRGTLAEQVDGRLVSFETDGIDPAPDPRARRLGWSVLVRGLALRLRDSSVTASARRHLPQPLVPVAGELVYSIRPDVVSGRRFPVRDVDVAPVVRR